MVLRGLNLSKSVHGGKRRESKTGKPSLNHFQGPKLKLIKSLRACLDQNKVEGPKLDFCKTRGTKNALNPYYYAMIRLELSRKIIIITVRSRCSLLVFTSKWKLRMLDHRISVLLHLLSPESSFVIRPTLRWRSINSR